MSTPNPLDEGVLRAEPKGPLLSSQPTYASFHTLQLASAAAVLILFPIGLVE